MGTILIENRKEIDEIIRSCKTCYLGMCDGDKPYVIPMNFSLNGDVVILHSAQSGRMWEAMKKNPKVCVTWSLGEELAYRDVQVGCTYHIKSKSVIAEGKVEFVDDFDEKVRCLKLFMTQYVKDREFKFNPPAVRNVGIIKMHITTISAKEFGVRPKPPKIITKKD